MNPTVAAALIAGAFGLIGTLIGIWWEHGRSGPLTPKSSGPFGTAVLKWLNISNGARKKLGRSVFIPAGGIRNALMDLVESAKATDSILAICGNKGDYAQEYYRKNFEKCRAVKRVFSYEAILAEIKNKSTHSALDGLILHLDPKATVKCNVETFLIPKGKHLGELGSRNFDPPLSFGLAILRDGNDSPRKAIVHWEMDAEPLKHLIAIEGMIIDYRQAEVLDDLVKLHNSIAGSNIVLTSENDLEAITTTRDDLQLLWEQQRTSPGGTP